MSAAAASPARIGAWRVWTMDPAALAAEDLVAALERLAAGVSLHRSKHADTYRWARPGGDVYVKVYRRYRRWTAFKDWFRPSKAANVRAASAALAAAGFLAPAVLAVGEERRGPFGWSRSVVVTAGLAGEPIAARLAALAAAGDATTRHAKRGLLGAIGREVARLHAAGFVAGDLVPANLWVALANAELRLAFLDHDRTRAGRAPAPWRRARRNLVQLNRVVLAGITATDRLRVYRAYATTRGWARAGARRRLLWIVAKTLARRRAERGARIPAAAGFRTVMRADGPYGGGRT
ncbi:MAG: hypothetical protein IT293_02680 [Deltaproteobacteria bacterium]|nr:hypothetical protein [Deltaproteobacteria bacterium]